MGAAPSIPGANQGAHLLTVFPFISSVGATALYTVSAMPYVVLKVAVPRVVLG